MAPTQNVEVDNVVKFGGFFCPQRRYNELIWVKFDKEEVYSRMPNLAVISQWAVGTEAPKI